MIFERFPNIEELEVIEDGNCSMKFGVGTRNDKFKHLKKVDIDKSATSSTIDVILDRVNQFDNV